MLSTRVDLSFLVHKLAIFLSNTGKVYFEGLVHLLKYIRENKTLGLKYYADMKDAPLSDRLIQAIIKTDNLGPRLAAEAPSKNATCPGYWHYRVLDTVGVGSGQTGEGGWEGH